MNIKYLYSQIRHVLSQLHELTGLMISLHDTDKEIARCANTMAGFCELIHSSPVNHGLCDSDVDFYRRTLDKGEPIKHVNPCGLYEVAIPFYLAGQRAGVLAIGQFRMEDSPSKASVSKFACDMQVDEQELQKEYDNLPMLDDNKIKVIVDILQVMLDGILAEKLIQFTRPKLIDTIMGYIRDNPGDDLTSEALSRRFALSRSKLFQLFNQEGTTLHSYVIEQRMKYAAALLRENILSNDEICNAINCPNKSYFCRMFRKYYGMSAERYRNNIPD